jgi:uncharacterized protein
MTLRSIPAPLWMAAALFPMVVSQIVRLQQSDPAAWIFWDYAGRLGALAVLGAIPSARTIAFRFEPFRMARWEAAIWIIGIVAADHYLGGGSDAPSMQRYPQPCLGHIRKRKAGFTSSISFLVLR